MSYLSTPNVIFVDVEGEDEGPKAPIYKPASVPPSNPSCRAACIFLHDVAEEGKNFTRTSLLAFVSFTISYISTNQQLLAFASISADYNLPHLQWVFPTAPWNTRIRQPAWFTPTRFSRYSSKLPNANAPEDEEEILRSVQMVVNIIDDLVKQGVLAKRIVVGGQGQGHCIALVTSMVSKYSGQLGGVIGQCGYLPLRDRISVLREKQGLPKELVPVPLLLACAIADAYLPETEFEAQVHKLKGLGYTDATIKIRLYRNMSCLDAAMSPTPLKETLDFLGKVVPQLEEGEGGLKGSQSSQARKKDEKVAADGLKNEQSEDGVFQSLVERSITAWQSLNYFDGRTTPGYMNINTLRRYSSLESVLEGRRFWFFQRRESFMRQAVFMKWDPHRLDEYVLLPIDYGFVNKQDCFFVSHYWRTKQHPDPEAVDLSLMRQDLEKIKWSYIWVDWTCLPQVPRSEVQEWYFNKILQCIPMLIRDCAFEWRFPTFEPRAWILLEVAENVFCHKGFIWTDDNRPFILHLQEMLAHGVRPVVDKYGYKCTSKSDLRLIIGWLEIHIILVKILRDDMATKRQILDHINKPETGCLVLYDLAKSDITVDKAKGFISYNGATYKFTPIYHLRSDAARASLAPGKALATGEKPTTGKLNHLKAIWVRVRVGASKIFSKSFS
ncbi:MAG: hypothetical protein M1839_003219 [Geoglossum umbratile]|nr:MAG: hypothetical protein M1839_003219 [Geoglossum umbratile]